jgi:hypothetical protein
VTAVVELTLLNGDRRTLSLPSHTGSLSAALGRLHDWIETDDGSWVQKQFVVEVRLRAETGEPAGSRSERRQLEAASQPFADQAG